jgi:hypothetical protein
MIIAPLKLRETLQNTSRIAECRCGQLQISCVGDPVRVSICHCLACQRRTGSPFGEQARFARDQIHQMSGRSKTWERDGDEGSHITYHFCPNCGSTVYYELDVEPDLIAIPVGAFAEPTFQSPTYSFHELRKHEWVVVPEGPGVVHEA